MLKYHNSNKKQRFLFLTILINNILKTVTTYIISVKILLMFNFYKKVINIKINIYFICF
jgi:hypothetical protein